VQGFPCRGVQGVRNSLETLQSKPLVSQSHDKLCWKYQPYSSRHLPFAKKGRFLAVSKGCLHAQMAISCEHKLADIATSYTQTLQRASHGCRDRVVNCVAFKSGHFALYWENAQNEAEGSISGPSWHVYEMKPDGLAHAYFISNAICAVSPPIWRSSYIAWYPIDDPSGKEIHRRVVKPLEDIDNQALYPAVAPAVGNNAE
jgi:hypothetical protein